MTTSPFLDRPRLMENELAFAIYDAYPVTSGHVLVIPKRIFADYFEASAEERAALWDLVDRARRLLLQEFGPLDFNIGINIGRYAGQTVEHSHIHVIPRRSGDVPDPRGGIRAIIPGKAFY